MRPDETFEVGKLNVVVVVWLIARGLFRLIEYLHAEKTKDIEKYDENLEEIDYYWHNFKESCEQSLQYLETLEVDRFNALGSLHTLDQTSNSEYTYHQEYGFDVGFRFYKEEKHPQQNDKSIDIVETVSEEILGSNCNDPDD